MRVITATRGSRGMLRLWRDAGSDWKHSLRSASEIEYTSARRGVNAGQDLSDRPVSDPLTSDRQLFEELTRAGVAATFFVNGAYLRRDLQLWRSIAAAGYPIGNHTVLREVVRGRPLAQVVADLVRNARLVQPVTGRPMIPVFRQPYRYHDAALRRRTRPRPCGGYQGRGLGLPFPVVAGRDSSHPRAARQPGAPRAARPGDRGRGRPARGRRRQRGGGAGSRRPEGRLHVVCAEPPRRA